jgi:hypothetical protein
MTRFLFDCRMAFPIPLHHRSWPIVFLVCTVLALFRTETANAAVFPVLTNSDVAGLTLRAAITNANLIPGRDTIIFAIPGTGPFTISVLSPLPQLTDPAGVLIDGFTQPGSSFGANPPSTLSLMIVIDGTGAGFAHGFWIVSPFNTIRGLVIQNFARDGIRIQATPAVTHTNLVWGNFIGTNAAGTAARGNGTISTSPWAGVNILVDPATSGTVTNNRVCKCLVSANYSEGVSISSCPPGDAFLNMVDSNYIGTTANGMLPLGNRVNGVYIGEAAHDNIVSANIISANDTDGVCIVGYVDHMTQWFTRKNIVTRNIIGLAADRSTPLPNQRHGVSIGIYGQVWWLGFAPENVISLDTIAWNGGCGVMIWEHPVNSVNTDMNRITQNAMYANGLLGIELDNNGVSANDPGDLDSSANQCINMPVIASALRSGSAVVITGTISTNTNPTAATVELFKAAPDPTGYGEGARYLGAATPDGSGAWAYTVASGLNVGDTVTATVTDLNGNTSEFALISRVLLPVELLSFDASWADQAVVLEWMTGAESNNAGFEIERGLPGVRWSCIGRVEGHGSCPEAHVYRFIDSTASSADTDTLWYRLRQMDYDGSATMSAAVAVLRSQPARPAGILALYPQPSHGAITIAYGLARRSQLTIRFFDLAGRQVLMLPEVSAGEPGIHVTAFDIGGLPSGWYFVRWEAENAVDQRRFLLAR